MSELVWDATTKRLYETGIDHGVLYLIDANGEYPLGVAWNGLKSVTEASSGAEVSLMYADNVKYLSLISVEEFGGTIEAYDCPKEFNYCDGSYEVIPGVFLGQNPRQKFGFVYRTRIGNDVTGDAYGYKLHLVYGATAGPSEKNYVSVNDSPEALSFSWEFTTTPISFGNFRPTSLIVIDSTKVEPECLQALEKILYGTNDPAPVNPRLPLPEEVDEIFSYQPMTNPVGWSWSLPISIERYGKQFQPANDFDVSSYANTGKVYYVSPTGNDLNDGLAADNAHALRSIDIAIAKADADVVYIATGTYLRSNSWDGATLSRSMSIIGTGGIVKCANVQDNVTWTLTAGQTNTYQTTRSSAGKVLDASRLDANGDYEELVLRSSIATVESNPGSYWINGTIVYVHSSDNRVPDTNIWITINARNGKIMGDVHVYCENIDFIGGYAGLEFDNSGAGQTPEFYAKNCKFRHTMGNGLETTGVSLAIVQDCSASKNESDGFNYHILNSVVPKVIEIRVVSHDNGNTGDVNNASSIHDGGSILRIMGVYSKSNGPNVVDSAALESWNVGCISHSSRGSIPGARIDWNMAGGSGKMWLDRVTSYGSDNGIVAGAGTTIYKRSCSTTVADGGAGTVTNY